MKVENISQIPHTNSVKNLNLQEENAKGFASILNMKEASPQSVELPKKTNKEMIQDFAEWYFKQGKVYENTRSYKMAISAYEKANSVEPDLNKAESIDGAREKAFKKG